MRRKITSIFIAGFIILATWAIPKYLEVNNMITQQNSYWLLNAVYFGASIVACVLIWGYWSMIQPVLKNTIKILSKLRRLRLKFTLEPVKEQKDIATRFVLTAINNSDGQLLDSYKRQINYDRAHLRELLVVRNERLLLHSLDPVMGGQLHFAFDVFNGSVLSVKVGYQVEGHLMVQGKQFHDMAELQMPSPIDHGIWNTIAIKQRMLPEVVKEIRDDAVKPDGIVLRFDFQDVRIHIEEGGVNQANLKIVETMKFRVKRDDDPIVDSYTWERIS